jgi:hypothetical protein
MRELPVHLTLLNWETSFDYVKKNHEGGVITWRFLNNPYMNR